MAKKKKKKQLDDKDFFSWKPNLSPEAQRDIAAVALIVFSIMLLLAMVGIGGSLPSALFQGLVLGFGFAAYLLPLLFCGLAWMLFQPEKYELKANKYIGMVLSFLSLTALLSIVAPQMGGGYLGMGIDNVLLPLLKPVAAFILMTAVLVVGLITASNSSLRDIFNALFRRGPKEEIQINEATGSEMPYNRLPIRGTIGGSRPTGKEDEGALTVAEDADWQAPSIDLLEATSTKADAGNIKQNAGTIQSTLASFGIEVAMSEVNVGPTVTQYTLKPESGVKLNKITALEHNLSLSLAAHPLRVEAPIPGKSAVGIEVPNKTSAIVRMKDLLTSKEFEAAKSPLEFVLGRDVSGTPAVADLAKMPHLLIAGATGSGKSVMINTFLTSLLYRNSPSNLKLILVDPKRVELTLYNDIPHLLTPVIVEPEKCISALRWAVAEMERRYKLFSEVGKRNIGDYNQAKKEEAMPYIVIVIDELADLMSIAAQDVEALVVRLAQMARATGIHLVLATQRPSVNVITGLIKANIPARIAFSVASQFDSRTILDQGGAEKLLGKGDMLFSSPELPKPRRLQGAMISDKETKAVTDYLRDARAPQYNEEVLTQPGKGSGGRSGGFDMEDVDDDLFEEAADTVIRSGKASASLLQRRLRVGYARAARLLDILEERGVVGPPDGARPRDVLVSSMSDVNGGGAPPDEGFGEQ